jgi:hypothetical protein
MPMDPIVYVDVVEMRMMMRRRRRRRMTIRQ